MVKVTFWSLGSEFKRVNVEQFDTAQEALTAARQYAEPQGYTKLKLQDEDCEFDGSQRITGTTPGGRAGRNVCTVDQVFSEQDYT